MMVSFGWMSDNINTSQVPCLTGQDISSLIDFLIDLLNVRGSPAFKSSESRIRASEEILSCSETVLVTCQLVFICGAGFLPSSNWATLKCFRTLQLLSTYACFPSADNSLIGALNMFIALATYTNELT